ncbi:MAG: dTDP-glucose 4,6-dehydratase [Actinomycetota bacterium]
MKLFVPGGAGFIGSAFVGHAVSRGHEVTVLDALTYRGRRDNLDGVDHAFVQADIIDAEALDEHLPGHDAVVNFANGSFVDRSIQNPEEFVFTNSLGTARLVEAVRRHQVPRMLHVSTDEVYGSIDPPGAFRTTHPLDPSSPYSATKAAADVYCLASYKTFRTPVLIARMCNIFGPRQHPENLIPRFVTNLLRGEPVGLYGDGRNVREWLHVDPACDGLLRVLDAGTTGEVYHLGSGVEKDNLTIAHRLAELTGADRGLITFVDDRLGHDRRYRLDLSRTVEELGWKAASDFDSQLADTVEWYRSNRDWWES